MKKLWVVALVSLLISISLLSSNVDQVFLKNGQVITGTVQNYEIGKFVEIKNNDGRLQIINWDQIESLDIASEQEQQEVKSPADMKIDVSKKGITFDQTLDSDQLRLNWQSQGGSIRGYEVSVNYITTKMEFSDSLSGKMKLNGAGFGYTGNINFLKFTPPNYADKKYYTYAVKLGFSAAMSANMFKAKSNYEFVDEEPGIYLSTIDIDVTNNISIGTFEAGLNLGANFGLGSFLNPQKWGGVILGISWRPTWQYTTTNIETITDAWYETEIYVPYYQYFLDWDYTTDKSNDSKSQFSWSAVEMTLDIGGIKAMTDKMAKRSHFRLNFMYIPPIGSYKMSTLFLGIGMVWYR